MRQKSQGQNKSFCSAVTHFVTATHYTVYKMEMRQQLDVIGNEIATKLQ